MGNLNCKKSDEEILAAEEDGNPLDRSRHDLSLSQLPSSEEPNGNVGNKYDLDSGINNTTTSSPNLTAHGYDRPSIGDLFPNLKGSTQLSDEFDLYDYLAEKSWGMIFMHPGKLVVRLKSKLSIQEQRKKEKDLKFISLLFFSF